ncbi:MAG: LysR family transcriptional regulator [Chthoniobacterales bacterium]
MTAFDDLSLLRAFIGIVECGSISAAARRLKIPQPTLSRYLRVLEERCDGPLLRRDTHQMSLTQTGRRFLADANAMVAHAEEADQHLREGQTTHRCTRCAGGKIAGRRLLMWLVRRIRSIRV